ncbi:MAG: glycosyltransferase [Dehalococcoidia bacterium]|nr:glycosyltransferase [Dehalococcoidia bacterium]
MLKLSIVIPVRNEAASVLPVIEKVRAVDCGLEKELIVVDDGSTDDTRRLLLSLGPAEDLVLVLNDEGLGKGAAMRAGFERASGDLLIVQDGDLELDPAEIPALLEPILAGRAQATFGSRFLSGRGQTPLVMYLGNWLLTRAVNILFSTRLTDLNCCYKLMPTQTARSLGLTADGFDIEAELTCRLLQQGRTIVEVPVSYRPRTQDEGKKLRIGAGWTVLRTVVRLRFSRPPLGGQVQDTAS